MKFVVGFIREICFVKKKNFDFFIFYKRVIVLYISIYLYKMYSLFIYKFIII